MKKVNNKKGFTLAELLVVVAILAILIAIAIPVFGGALNKAKQTADDANIRSAFAQHTITEMQKASFNGTVPIADQTAVVAAFNAINVPSLQYYGTITVPSDGAAWHGDINGGTSGVAVASVTVHN